MKNKLLNIYCARYSKSKKHINLTLVSGEGEAREYYTATLKIKNEGKIQVEVKDKTICINMPLSLYDKVDEDVEITEALQDNDLPF